MFFEASLFQKSHSPCRKKKIKRKGGPVIDPTKGHKWPSYKPYSIYIYIYPDG